MYLYELQSVESGKVVKVEFTDGLKEISGAVICMASVNVAVTEKIAVATSLSNNWA